MMLLDAIPPDHRAAVAEALADLWRGKDIALVDRLTGVSALGVFHIRVAGEGDFVLRLDPRADALRDPQRQAACIHIAAAGGVTPPHLLVDKASGISIARFVAPVQRPWGERLADAARRVRQLHDLPRFPAHAPYREQMDMVRGGLAQLPILPEPLKLYVLGRFGAALDAYPWDDDLVSSHNDLNPSNFLFDGERHWIVDWETAFAADRYVDLATLSNWLTSDAAGEDALLHAYFGREPTAYERARHHLMRQINRLFYGGMLLMAVGMEAPGLVLALTDWDDNPGLDALRPEMSKLAIFSGRVRFGLAFLKDGMTAMADPAYAEASRTTSVPR